jgi:adenylate cyclase
MTDSPLLTQVSDWLIEQALGEPEIADLFEGVCQRLYGIGVPIARGRLAWSTLHPLFRAEQLLWRPGHRIELEQLPHLDVDTEAWLKSPYRFLLQSGAEILRRRLTGPERLLDFPVLEDLAAEGYTDYVVIGTSLFSETLSEASGRGRGVFAVWASDRPAGFSADHLASLKRIQRYLGVACKTVIQRRIARNVVDAYLGKLTGEKVLNGLIRRGDGEETRALVWYSDLRNSTRLAETMPTPAFLELLGEYFECATRPVIDAGGEVLDFIGDAVLAIFPAPDDAELPALAHRVMAALKESLDAADRLNAERALAGKQRFDYGVGLNIGPVMYGNIGVPERLAFTAVGPTIIEVARIEKLTKTIAARVLATREVASFEPALWRPMGEHPLEGVGKPQALFGFREEVSAAQAA